ncbi:MAG: LytR/AlgR family response regulator transcription factor [Bacteroidia bacterium]
MIKAIAIDDDPIALKVIENFCAGQEQVKLEKTFSKPLDALDYLNSFPVDLVFIDIDMPQINGLELSKKIRQDAMIIFCTTHTEYAIEGFNLNAVDYIAKPYSFERFNQAITKAVTFFGLKRQQENSEDPKFIFLRADYTLNKISVADIIYIEALDDYLKLHLEGKKPLVARMTMKDILKKLPVKEFIRVQRSFIVPVARIEKVKSKSVIVSGREISIGSKYQEELLKLFPDQQN